MHSCCHILSHNVFFSLSSLDFFPGPAASVYACANSANEAAAYTTVDLQGLLFIISLLELPAGAVYLPRLNCHCRCLYVTMLTVTCVHTASNLSFDFASPSPYTRVCACLHVCIYVHHLLVTRISLLTAAFNTYHRVHVTSCIIP